MGNQEDMEQLEAKRAWALGMGGPKRIARQHERGRLTARERIDKLVDPGTFFEVGMLAHAAEPEWAERTPGDGLICGYGKIDDRTVTISATDATVLGGSDSAEAASRKRSRLESFAREKGYPQIELGEGGGGRIHNLMGWQVGSAGVGGEDLGRVAPREQRVPIITAVLGNSYGRTSFRAGYSDWVVMTKGSSMSISSPRLVEVSIGEKVDDQELGGWELHARRTGQVDMVTEGEDAALAAVRDVVGYLPSRATELPPIHRTGDDPRRREEALATFVPETIRRAFNMTRLISHIVDDGKVMAVKPDFGRSMICGLARLDGHSVGVIANNSMVQAGAIDADAAVKTTKFITMCNTFNIPLVFFHDVPGVLIGRQQEEQGIISKINDLLDALRSCSVPRLAVIIRKSYGLAYVAMSGSYAPNSFTFAWPSARMGFMAPDSGVRVAYGGQLAEQGLSEDALKAKYEELIGDWEQGGLPWGAAGAGYIDDVIDPRDTRWTLIRALDVALGHDF